MSIFRLLSVGLLTALFLTFSVTVWAQDDQQEAEQEAGPEAEPEVEPEAEPEAKVDAVLIAIGRRNFATYCKSCHGTRGRGDGAVAKHLTVHPSDLTRLSKKNRGVFPFDRVVAKIDGRGKSHGYHGSSDMPAWGKAFKKGGESEDGAKGKIVALAHFLQSIQMTEDD